MRGRDIIISTLVTTSVLVTVGWGLWQLSNPESPTASLEKHLRLPQNMPEWLEVFEGGAPEYGFVRAGFERPWLIILWRVNETYRQYSLSLLLAVVDTEVEMDLGGQREPVTVDGVQGWLTHLGPEDFVPPTQGSFYEFTNDWRYDRTVYRKALKYRVSALGIWGPALALQWNREGTHYLMMVQSREPMTAELLLQMADSMAPGEFPFEYGPYGLPPEHPLPTGLR